jgi:DNA replication licensing factor MCM4
MANPQLYKELLLYPQELVPLMDLCINQYKDEKYPTFKDSPRIQVRPFNLMETTNMRELDPEDIDTLVSIKGMVIRCGQVTPDQKTAFFQCLTCAATVDRDIEDGNIDEPTRCTNCQQNNTMQMIYNRGYYSDKQQVKIQETPDSVPEGQTPHTITVYAYGDLVDVAKPGDRVEITGVYRARHTRPSQKRSTQRAVYITFLDAIHFKKTDERRMNAEDSKAEKGSDFFTPFEESDIVESVREEKEETLRELSRHPELYALLTRSIAPNIWQMDDVKKGLLCLLFGGTNIDGASSGRFRGEINILMCGDPGTAKSQLLQYVHKIAPRGIYTSGKGSSAVGLTAYITKDPETREMVLESGALVLSDRGVCCIDEFDKMNDSTRSILHEVMEQQTVSIAKAGIVCTLNARTSILASANPKESRYNPRMSVVQNIELGPTLLSRFDLIYLVLDIPDEARDRKLAKHLVSLYFDDAAEKLQLHEIVDMATLSAYVSYARRSVKPQLTEAASNVLVQGYVEMRDMGRQGANKVISATPRQLEAMIRLSEALARMRLSAHVEERDANEALRLMRTATAAAATDPNTGEINMDLINTGVTDAESKRMQQQMESLRELLEQRNARKSPQQTGALRAAFNANLDDEFKVNQNDFQELLKALVSDGSVKLTSVGGRRRTVTLL